MKRLGHGRCIPAFSEKSLTAAGIYHPLVDNAITNDFSLTKNIIITGSNASGKSTFIKAVAINLILGQSIHTCTADLELANALDGRYENFYFCESMEGKDVVFDYKLCTGISHTNNAIRLLESMGFPEEIVLEAKRRKFIENKLHT